jgi:hypothetical protein
MHINERIIFNALKIVILSCRFRCCLIELLMTKQRSSSLDRYTNKGIRGHTCAELQNFSADHSFLI